MSKSPKTAIVSVLVLIGVAVALVALYGGIEMRAIRGAMFIGAALAFLSASFLMIRRDASIS